MALPYVLAARGDWVPRGARVLLFWPDHDDDHARCDLRQVLRVARRLAFAGDLEVERQRVRWPVPLATRHPGWTEQDPEDWVAAADRRSCEGPASLPHHASPRLPIHLAIDIVPCHS